MSNCAACGRSFAPQTPEHRACSSRCAYALATANGASLPQWYMDAPGPYPPRPPYSVILEATIHAQAREND